MNKLTENDIPLWPVIEDGSFAAEWIRVGLTAGPRVSDTDIRALMAFLDLPCSTITWAENPTVGGRACRLAIAGVDLSQWDGRDIDPEWVEARRDQMSASYPGDGWCRWGQHEAGWVAYRAALRGAVEMPEIDLYEPIVRGCSRIYHAGSTVILVPRVTPRLDADGNLHCADGPAIWDWYALHGIVLPAADEWIVRQVEGGTPLTREQIDGIANAEIRRVVIATYPGSYVQGDPIQADDYGALYDVGDPDFRVVRVQDPSTDRVYWLRVRANVATAHEGVASTFDLSAEEYHPQVQT
jgi:hypothetical protein